MIAVSILVEIAATLLDCGTLKPASNGFLPG
jgi:hypothetical protein